MTPNFQGLGNLESAALSHNQLGLEVNSSCQNDNSWSPKSYKGCRRDRQHRQGLVGAPDTGEPRRLNSRSRRRTLSRCDQQRHRVLRSQKMFH